MSSTPEPIKVGPSVTSWHNPPFTELAGREVLARVGEGQHDVWWLRLEQVYHRTEDGQFYHYYVPLPRDKEELKKILLEIAEHRGIDLANADS